MSMDIPQATILIVDDTPENIDVLRGILEDKYSLKIATNGQRALKIANADEKPDLILLDIMMPEMDGYEVCRQLKSNYQTENIPVVFVTAKNEISDEAKGFDLGAVEYIAKPIIAPLVLRRVQNIINLHNSKRLLADQVREQTKVIDQTRLQIIHRLGRAAEYKDNETGMHVIRMSHYSKALAKATGMNEQESELILNASPMHDIGKIGIPDNILRKPGKLDSAEWDTMVQHPQIGADILGQHESILLNLAREISLTHHEKYNGKGYPSGLKGNEIPISGRIVAIADCFDALTSERPYKEAWSVTDAVELIKKESGEHFDPGLVDLFVEILPEIIELKEQYAETK